MTTPNPALVAAAPSLDAALALLDTFVTTTLTGDPMQIGLRADASFKVFSGNIELLFPELASAEVGAVKTEISGGIAALRAKLKAATTVPAQTSA